MSYVEQMQEKLAGREASEGLVALPMPGYIVCPHYRGLGK